MQACTVAYYQLLRILRDKGSMVQMIATPVILIFILGNSLAGVFEPASIGQVPLAYLNEGEPIIAGHVDQFLEQVQIEQFFEVIPVQSYQDGIAQINDHDYPAFLYVTGDNQIQIIGHTANSLRVSLLENIMQHFAYGANTTEAFARLGRVGEQYHFHSGLIEDVPISVAGKSPRAIDYYAVTMLVLIVLYGALYASYGLSEDLLEPIGARIRATPVRMASYLTGKTIALVFAVFIQSVVLVLFTRFVFGANWGTNYGVIFFIAFTMSMFTTVLGIFVIVIARDAVTASGFLNAFIPVSTALAGGYFKFASPGKAFDVIRHISPNYLGQTAFFNAIYGDSMYLTTVYTGALWLVILLLLGIAVIFGRRRLV